MRPTCTQRRMSHTTLAAVSWTSISRADWQVARERMAESGTRGGRRGERRRKAHALRGRA
jgi:hypothetical protein